MSLIYVKEPEKPERFEEREQPGLWMTHDPAIYRDPVSGDYFVYSTGALGKRSRDLIHWENLGKVVPRVPEEAYLWTGSRDIWAPDIVKVGKEYRLYCSNSSWGVQQSCIFLAVSDRPEGPFLPRGIVLKTGDALPVNGIDANIIEDHATGELSMLYGSFWGGCYVLPLDKETGLSRHPESVSWKKGAEGKPDCRMERIIGKCVARRPLWMSGAIEGPYMIWNAETGYYYLFVSYGSLKTDYQIRVGRSRSIEGPFLDARGRDLIAPEDDWNEIGNLLMAGYAWNEGTAYMGPGHNSILRDEDERWYVVLHIREKNFTEAPEPSTMQVRSLYFSREGWPYVSPGIYAGEGEMSFSPEELRGFYERIDFVPSVPQGISTASPMRLGEAGYYEHCSVQGSWEIVETGQRGTTLRIAYGPHREEVHAALIYDRERETETIGLCGVNERGIAFWAKKRIEA